MEAAALREGALKREAALQLEAAVQREEAAKREAALREAALRREMEALRASLGGVQGAVTQALAAERARAAEQVARDRYEHDQRMLWLRSPECVLRVLTLVAQNGYPALGFSSLSRAFWLDEELWNTIKDRVFRATRKSRLMFCAWKGDLIRARWLLERGARVNRADPADGHTALMFASEEGHLEIVRALLGRGAKVNAAMTDDGATSLICASLRGHLEVVRELLGRGANVNAACTDDGLTSLMLACKNDHLEIARLLLAHGASKTAVNTAGKTAFNLTPAASASLLSLVKP